MEERMWIANFSSSRESVFELNLSLQGLQFIYDWQNTPSQFWKIYVYISQMFPNNLRQKKKNPFHKMQVV